MPDGDGVLKELMIFVLVYNLIRAAMSMAGQRQGVDPNRISFIDTARWLRSQCTPPRRKQRWIWWSIRAREDGTRV